MDCPLAWIKIGLAPYREQGAGSTRLHTSIRFRGRSCEGRDLFPFHTLFQIKKSKQATYSDRRASGRADRCRHATDQDCP